MISIRVQALAALLALAPAATAQVPPGEAGEDTGKVTFEQRENGMVEITRNGDGSVSERVLTPREVEDRRQRDGLGTVTAGQELVHGQAYPNPRRMAPGQSGTLKVMAFFGGSCVALPGGHIKLKLQPVEGLVFGVPVLQAASKGTIPGAFVGRPVYDDFLLFDVPLQVAETAKPATKIYLEGDLKLELHSSKTGARLGSFSVKVGGRVPIGKRLPESHIAVPGRTKTPKGTGAKSTGGRKIDPARRAKTNPNLGTSGDSRPDVANGGAAGVLAAADPVRPTDRSETETDPGVETLPGDGGSSWLMFGLGGLIVAVLALVLVFRRK